MLDEPANLVTVGLPYTAELETMPVEILGQSGTSVGLKKQINTVDMVLQHCGGMQVGISSMPGSLDNVSWQNMQRRSTEPYGSPSALFSGISHLVMPHLAENLCTVCIRSESPEPVTVQSVISRVEIKG